MRPFLVTVPLLLAAVASPALAAGGPQCPPTVSVTAQPEAPGGWAPYPGRDSHSFIGITLIEGDRAQQMATTSRTTLAPDSETRHARRLVQIWEFDAAQRGKLFVLCRYRGTEATLAADLPRQTRRCTLTLETDIRGNVLDEPKTPPQLDCR
ncbi:STY0301 family protein [Azospirillum palustre]